MLRLLADENLNHDLIRGVLRRLPSLDIVRVQDVGLQQRDDPTVLEWAARERRIIVTHDANTMPAFAFERIRRSESMPGLLVVTQSAALANVIDDLVLIAECADGAEYDGQVIYVPLSLPKNRKSHSRVLPYLRFLVFNGLDQTRQLHRTKFQRNISHHGKGGQPIRQSFLQEITEGTEKYHKMKSFPSVASVAGLPSRCAALRCKCSDEFR